MIKFMVSRGTPPFFATVCYVLDTLAHLLCSHFSVVDPESRVGGFLSGLRTKRMENFYRPHPLFLNHTLICKPATRTVGYNMMTGSAGGKLLERRLIELKN